MLFSVSCWSRMSSTVILAHMVIRMIMKQNVPAERCLVPLLFSQVRLLQEAMSLDKPGSMFAAAGSVVICWLDDMQTMLQAHCSWRSASCLYCKAVCVLWIMSTATFAVLACRPPPASGKLFWERCPWM